MKVTNYTYFLWHL